MSDTIREHIQELYADVRLQYEKNIEALRQLERRSFVLNLLARKRIGSLPRLELLLTPELACRM